MAFERIIIVRDKTPLEALLERFPSRPQARFYLDRSGGDYASYERAHDQFYRSLQKIKRELRYCLPFKILERKYLDRYIFAKEELIVVLGRDGLVANTAKYINGQPIIGVNPDQKANDGILLPDTPQSLYSTVKRVLNAKASFSPIQMAEARLNDGQRLLAFNDFFIGREGHNSAHYKLRFDGKEENQSSSGIIVSTGAGATGWMSSVFEMARSVNGLLGGNVKWQAPKLDWDASRLMYVVREPFLSKHSGVSLSSGIIEGQQKLVLESQMPHNGVIFSDGMQQDRISFHSGAKVSIGLAREKAYLVK
ncbi:MAG: hypothetical protein AAF927_02120 [Bacteroidota bacterium]